MLHKHKWNTIETYKFNNELNQFKSASMDGFTARNLASRGIISVCQCEICSKVKHIKTIFE